MVSARVRREQVAFVQARGRSHRRACALLTVARSTAHYVSRLQASDAPAVAAMRTLAVDAVHRGRTSAILPPVPIIGESAP